MIWLLRMFLIMLAVLMRTAHADFLPPDQAFQFEAISTSQDSAELKWKIADGYYLYHEQLKVIHGQTQLKINLPVPQDKDDPTFGMTQVHYGQVSTHIRVQPKQKLNIQWQGCAESGLCYPIQRSTIQTDAEGLLPVQQLSETRKLFNTVSNSPSALQPSQVAEQTETREKNPVLEAETSKNQKLVEPENLLAVQLDKQTAYGSQRQAFSEANTQSEPQIQQDQTTLSLESKWNNDQFFFNLLSNQNLWVNLLVFLGLGILLAFLPCSLPLIPILSGILVQRKTGYRAVFIAGAFIFGMAIVYAIMGLAVAQLGYSFQRWFQSPVFISLFALLFILFAFNLFGAFQLSLPQGILHRLDQWQQRQKGGALLMGMIAALIVGPCMSAPLAGALLFVSQLNQPLIGASYLFVLGLGIGLPIFIASVFGSHYLPKPGLWMDRLKFSFGFVMLALAIYFIRPLIPGVLYFILFGTVLLFLTGYCLLRILPHITRNITKAMLIILSIMIALGGIWHVNQAIAQISMTQADQTLAWQQVHNANELSSALARFKGQPVIIDVYADWCIACQPIEHRILKDAEVQQALSSFYLIKLDLSQYDASHQALLQQWDILGPPTYLFLDAQQQEIRALRLTGTFQKAKLLQQLVALKGH